MIDDMCCRYDRFIIRMIVVFVTARLSYPSRFLFFCLPVVTRPPPPRTNPRPLVVRRCVEKLRAVCTASVLASAEETTAAHLFGVEAVAACPACVCVCGRVCVPREQEGTRFKLFMPRPPPLCC